MENEYNHILLNKSDKYLKKILLNYSDYQEEFVRFVEKELNNRGVRLTPEEKGKIELMKISDIEEIKEEKKYRLFLSDWNFNIVNDNSVPELFSRATVLISTFFFTGLFGGILLMYNLFKIRKLRSIYIVLFISLLFSIIFYFLFNSFEPETFTERRHFTRALFGINGFISYFVYSRLWWKFIGKETKYRAKSNLIPIIIGVLLIIVYFLSKIMN